MADATTMRGARGRAVLLPEEVGPAFDGLSPDDKLKLHAIETILLSRTGLGRGDLLREAICRALEGERNCPRDVPIMAFLVKTMKSIASHARKKNQRTVLAPEPTLESEFADADEAPSPESTVLAKAALTAIYAGLENDADAMLVLMGWADGLRGGALREATGLDQGSLDYASKRIRTHARKLYPNGWLR